MSNRSTPVKQRIAILGAAFDPLHYGHCALAALVLHLGFADEVWLCPSPARWDKTPVAPPELRLRWVQMAVEHLQQQGLAVKACSQELNQPEYRGTLVFLRELSSTHPNKKFVWVLGQDALSAILSWRDPVNNVLNGAQLLAEYQLIVAPRPSSESDSNLSNIILSLERSLTALQLAFLVPPVALPQFAEVAFPLLGETVKNTQLAGYSSTQIREQIQNELSTQPPIYSDVWNDIVKSKFYKFLSSTV